MPTGTYQVAFAATDASGNPVSGTQAASGLVTGVSFASGGTASLIVNGNNVAISSVTSISAPPSSSNSPSPSSN